MSESASPYENFYWEIYGLFGDPSLMPYMGRPARLALSARQPLKGDNRIVVSGTPYSRVAATASGQLLGVCFLDSLGMGTIETTMPVVDSFLLTASAQYHVPIQVSVAPSVPGSARVVVTHISVADSRGVATSSLIAGDTMHVALHVANVGSRMADGAVVRVFQNHSDSLYGAALSLAGEPTGLQHLLPGCDTMVVFDVSIAETNKTKASFSVVCQDSMFADTVMFRMGILHPGIVLKSVKLLGDGRPVASIERGRQYTLRTVLVNTGSGLARNVSVSCNNGVVSHAEEYITPTDSAVFEFHVTAADTSPCLHVILRVSDNTASFVEEICYVTGKNVEGFEGADFVHYPWQMDTVRPWMVDGAVVHSGNYSVRSGQSEAGKPSVLSIVVNANCADSIMFWYKTSCRAQGDRMSFRVDGITMLNAQGQTDWRRAAFAINEGEHVLQWSYQKDDSGSVGEDCGWIDDLALPLSPYRTPRAGYANTTTAVEYADSPVETVNVSPNPTDNRLLVTTAGEATEIRIVDLYGRLVFEGVAGTLGSSTIHTAAWPDGLYFLHAKTKTGIHTIKIIVAH